MRTIVTSLMILILAGWIATHICPVPVGAAAAKSGANQWRRTAEGWERAEAVVAALGNHSQFAIHPALVAILQVLVSLFALVAAMPSTDRTERHVAERWSHRHAGAQRMTAGPSKVTPHAA